MTRFDYAGCIHFHSSYSYDARISLDQIIQAGLKTGLRYAILTDHFNLDAKKDGWEGYHPHPASGHLLPKGRRPTAREEVGPLPLGRGWSPDVRGPGEGLLLIVGEEISPRYNHYLALGIEQPIVVPTDHADPQTVIDAVSAQGGFGFLAHPDHEGAPLVRARAFPWIEWNVKGFAGLGIWDLISDWTASLSSPLGVLKACLWPAAALRGPRPQTLARWDALAQQGRCVAIGEVDNHGNRRRYFGFPKQVFSFEYAFRTIRTHVLLDTPLSGEAGEDQKRILSALRQGHSYVSMDLWQDPTGFYVEVVDERSRVGIGHEIDRQGPTLLEAKLPAPGRLRLIRNGRMIWEEERRACLQRDIDLPGVYRVEADQWVSGRWRPWIYSNPIWVKS